MTAKFERLAGTVWRADVGGVSIFIDDRTGQPDPSQHAIALRIAKDFKSIRDQAARYLDLFVDRRKACGKENVDWWLEEVELRGMHDERPRCRLVFTLDGDADGYWTVEMAAWPHGFHPARFERSQG